MPEQSDPDSATQPKRNANRSPYPEKGLVAGLQSSGEKLAAAAGQAMTEDELSDESMELFRNLVEQAQDFLQRIGEARRGDADFKMSRNRRSSAFDSAQRRARQI